MSLLDEWNHGCMVEVVLCSEINVMIVHWFVHVFTHVLDGVLAGLEAVEAVGALGLLEENVFGAEFLVLQIC